MALTEIRQAVQDELAADMAPIAFWAGRIDGPVEDRDVGCVWVNTLAPTDDVIVQAIDVRVRVFKLWRQPDSYPALDTSVLEDLAEQIQAALNDLRVAAAIRDAGAWFLQDMPSVEIDPETWGVEASVIALRHSPFHA